MGRRAGRPAEDEIIVTPEVLEQIGFMRNTGRTLKQIADRFGISFQTVHHHIEHTLVPIWEANVSRTANRELEKIDCLEQVAWEKFWESCSPQTRKQIKLALSKGTKDGETPELEIVERLVSKLKRTGEPVWLDTVRWCADARAKIQGHYKNTEHSGSKANTTVIVVVENREQAQKMMGYAEFSKRLAPKEATN